MEMQNSTQSDFWLKISGVPQELIKSTLAAFYNANPTTAKIEMNGTFIDVPVLDRMPDNTKICMNESCGYVFNDIADQITSCPKCGAPVRWRTWDPPFTSLGINVIVSTYLDYVNANVTTAYIKFSENQSKKISVDTFLREWAGQIASTFCENLYIYKKIWLTKPEERLKGPMLSRVWQQIATNVYSAMSKGNNAKMMDSSTSSRNISESKMEITNTKSQEEQNPIKNFVTQLRDKF